MAKNVAMTDKEKLEREKQLYLFLVAFGGHKFTMKKLKNYFRYKSELGISQFFYLEYFLHEPLRIGKDVFNKDGASVFCPFFERMIKEQPFLPQWTDDNQQIDTFILQLKNCDIDLLPRTRELEKSFLNRPLQMSTKKEYMKFGELIYQRCKDKNLANTIADVDYKYNSQNFIDDLDRIKKISNDDENKMALIKEILILIYPWAKSGTLKSEGIDIVAVPIASNKLFYGYILVGFFQEAAATNGNAKIICTNVKEKMEKQALEFYLPALILCHHSLYEKSYIDFEKNVTNENNEFSISEDMPFLYDQLPNSTNMLERNIHKLWKIRKENENILKDKVFRKSHFIFTGRYWGSPTSIKKIQEALTWDMNFVTGSTSDDKNKLKTFLIFGGPGSGKDTLSKMIGLFSSKHTFSEPYIVNMAALKPDWIAPPSLAGMTVKIDNGYPFTIDGIFKKVLDKSKLAEAKNIPNNCPVIIFDELNSLDIDTQGTLLRILENAEIVPIGGIDNVVETGEAEKLLVVGVVNEAPHQLTLEDTVKSFSRDKNLWGNLLGTALYESFRGVRRLRDDLYYRFIRGGYIELPNLDDRREDIPIIFFASLPEWLRNDIVEKFSEKKIFVEYDVWDLLTDVEIQWKGNIRQLQALANNIARKIKEEEIKGMRKRLDVPLVSRALEEMKKAHES